MKTKILTAVAILLAIPTYGISLVVWLFAKYKYDKFCATRVLINAAAISYNNGGVNEVRYELIMQPSYSIWLFWWKNY